MRKLTLFFAFLLSVMGVAQTWAQTPYTCGFESSDGWASERNSSWIYSITSTPSDWGLIANGKNLQISTTKHGGDNSLYSSTTNTEGYVVSPKLAQGTINLYGKRNDGSGYISVFKAVKDGDNYSIEGSSIATFNKTQMTNMSDWFELSFNVDEDCYVAILLSYAYVDDFSAANGLAVDDPDALAKPKNFAVSNVKYNSADLSWTAGGEETAWELVYGVSGFDKEQATPISITENPYTLTGLTENTTYDAYLRAKSGDDVSSWTSKVTFTTPAQYPAPTGFALAGFTANSASFVWTAGGTETAWQIAYSTDENFDPATSGTMVDVTENPYTLENLTAETTYYAYLRADYGTGYSAWSEKISFTPSATINTTINDVNTIKNSYIPVYGMWVDDVNYNKSQFIIPSSLITELVNRDIKKLTFYTDKKSIAWSGNVFDIYMQETSATSVSTTFDRTGDKVFTGTLSIDADGLMEVTLDKVFTYSDQNLLIGFDMTTKGIYGSASFYGVDGGSSMYTNNGSVTASTFLPKMTITSVPADNTPKAKMEVVSDDIDFGKVTPETAAADKQKSFTISNKKGTADLTNITVTSDNDAFEITLPATTITAGAEEPMTVTVTMNTENMEAGEKTATIKVNADGQEEVAINVTAIYANAAATMDVTLNDVAVTETVDFGTVRKETAKTFTVSNNGDLTLNATIASNNTADFVVTPANFTIAGGETGEFTVTFVMTEELEAEKSANITLVAEGLDNVVIAVKGTRTDSFGEDFEEATKESLESDGWEVSAGWAIGVVDNDPNNDTKQIYISNSFDLTYRTLVTPKLSANENDVLTFDVYYNYGDEPVKVSYSTDKNEWVEIINEANSDVSNDSKTITVNAPITGNFYLKFEARYGGGIDNIVGFKLAPQPTLLDQNETNTITAGVQDITLNYVFSKAAGRNYNTIAVPFEITDLSIFGEGVKAYTLNSYDETSGNITFTEVETLEAGKPYMLHADTPTTETSFAFYNVDVTNVEEGETSISGVTFHANYNYKNAGDITGEWYGVNSTTGNVQKAGSTTHLLAFRGYFTFDTTPAKLNVTFVDNNGDATTINASEILNNLDGNIYDLQGRKVNNAQKGIYIQNGKKVVIK